MPDFDIAALEIFRCVAQERSISKAAGRLGRVQSNVSTRVRQLEERLGVELFLRTRRGLIITDEGQTLLDYAERLIALSREASDVLSNGRPNGIFRLGTMESTAAARLPAVLTRYHALYPDVDVHLQTDTAGGLLDRLARGDIDAAFVAEPIAEHGFESRPTFTEELVLIVPATRPLDGDAGRLSGETVVAFEEGCAYRRYLQDWLLREGIVPRGTLAVGSYLAMLACVSAGAGFAVAPRSVLDMISSKGEFCRCPLPPDYSTIRTMLVWRKGWRSPKLHALDAMLPPPC